MKRYTDVRRSFLKLVGDGGEVEDAPADYDPQQTGGDPNDLACYDRPIPVDCPFDVDCPGGFVRERMGEDSIEWRCEHCDRTFTMYVEDGDG